MSSRLERRALAFVRKRLGIRAVVVGETSTGSPILQVGEHRLAYRRRGRERYLRPVVQCSNCRVEVTSRRLKVISTAELAEVASVSKLCRACRATKKAAAGAQGAPAPLP